jgi:Recombinase
MFAVASVVEDYRASVANTPRKRGRLSPENVAKGPLAAATARRATARAAHADIIGPITELRGHGLTFAAIANALNTEGRLTSRGRPWDAANVRRVVENYA